MGPRWSFLILKVHTKFTDVSNFALKIYKNNKYDKASILHNQKTIHIQKMGRNEELGIRGDWVQENR